MDNTKGGGGRSAYVEGAFGKKRTYASLHFGSILANFMVILEFKKHLSQHDTSIFN